MKFNHRETETREATIDMTPMMDIVFIMLIFFVLSASFTQTQALSVDRPSSVTKEVTGPEALMITVDRSHLIWLDGRQVGMAELTSAVRGATVGQMRNVIINADRTVPSGALTEVVDQIRLGGVANVAVATDAKRH